MKKKLYIFFLLIISLISINKVKAEEKLLTFDHSKDYEVANISNIISYKEGYIFSSEQNNSTIIFSYDNNDVLKSSKQLEDLKNVNIIKYNDNYLIAGINNNTLKLYLVDINLQIKKQLKTNYMVDNTSYINLYNYNNKIYLMLTEDGILSSNNLYEVDESLIIKDYTFSSMGSETIKEILKGDYYLIRLNSGIESEESTENIFFESTYLENKYILVGNNNNKGILTILDKDGNTIVNEINENYYTYNNVKIIKDKIVILAYNTDYYLLTYDFDGNLINEEKINIDDFLDITNMYKVGNKIVLELSERLKTTPNNSKLMFYSYNLNIFKEDSLFGTINIKDSSIAYEKINFEVIPNSGYEIDSVLIKDIQGNLINVTSNSFTMPENDVLLSVTYKEIITNPETIDYIIFIFPIIIIASFIMLNLYKKMSWLK